MNKRRTHSLRLSVLATVSLTLCACAGGNVEDATVTPQAPTAKSYEGTFKVGKPYQVDGKWYYPSFDTGYDEVGTASWYGPGFYGKRTANGEAFTKDDVTAAHRTMPMPSFARVTNLGNGKEVVVRVNDRGPFKRDRIIDVSKKAAEKLGLVGAGSGKVRVQFLKEESEQLWASLGMLDHKDMALASREPEETSFEVAAAPDVFDESQESRALGASAPVADVVTTDIAPPPGGRRAPTASVLDDEGEPAGGVIAPPALPRGRAPAVDQLAELPEKPAKGSRPVYPGNMPFKVVKEQEIAAAQAFAAANVGSVSTDESPVDEEVLAPAAQAALEAAPEQATSAVFADSAHYVQAGSYSVKNNAYNVASKLTDIAPVSVVPHQANQKTMYRVRVGPFSDDGVAEVARAKVAALGHADAKVVSE